MSATIVDKTYSDGLTLIQYLGGNGEVSLAQLYEESFRRILLLSSASLFEQIIVDALHGYCVNKTSSDTCILAMVRIKVIKRQYFTYFDWEKKNAGAFFALLGEVIGDGLKAEVKTEPLKQSLASFLELGYLRNCIVHQNFASFSFEKTSAEVYELYKSAFVFVEKVTSLLS